MCMQKIFKSSFNGIRLALNEHNHYPPPHQNNSLKPTSYNNFLLRIGRVISLEKVLSAVSEPITNKSQQQLSTDVESHSDTQKLKKILLLQGPVGPFFRQLQLQLYASGIESKRVTFHAADALFSISDLSTPFTGKAGEWEQWIRAELEFGQYDCVILFGSDRPAHATAIKVAADLQCPVISLEEGYLRSGYVTCELNGNNAGNSGLLTYQHHDVRESLASRPLEQKTNSTNMLVLWSAIYYAVRELTKHSGDIGLYHRKTEGILKETISWSLHYARRTLVRFAEANIVNLLSGKECASFILVPLQIPSDVQMQKYANGWTNEKLVTHCLHALRISTVPQNIVFKTHPLDKKAHDLSAFIKKQAKAVGLLDRVHILHSGNLSKLTEMSSGMIVINSTCAFSALHHNIPLLVLGKAIYRHQKIVTIGASPSDIHAFFNRRISKPSVNTNNFVNYVKSNALIAGDFYRLSDQSVTASNILNRIETLLTEQSALREVAGS